MTTGVATPAAISARKLPTMLASVSWTVTLSGLWSPHLPAAPLTHPLPTWQLREHVQASPFPASLPHEATPLL